MHPSTSSSLNSVSDDHSGHGHGWRVIRIEKGTEQGRNLYYNSYRPFRLEMLKEAPYAFSSTLAREAAFDREVWDSRFAHPDIHTFVAVVDDDGDDDDQGGEELKIISSLTLGSVGEREWEINGVFTDERYRRMGVASVVLREALRHATSATKGGDCVIKVGVTKGNSGAKAMYEKAGFVVETIDDDGVEILGLRNIGEGSSV
ncbi:acyl-CoA N-acyltransferase [Cladorrhinum sp. PSN259]|nr:acyl-CoA N-acyltransferase [Cladorrhinum sp. PSN259]